MFSSSSSLSSDPIQTYRLYTLERLVSLSLISPTMQRAVDESVVDNICEYQVQKFRDTNSFLFLGHLTVANVGGTLFLLDGQHRFRAMQRLYLTMPTYTVLVLTLNITPNFTLSDAFILLNKNTPVPDYIIQTTMDESKRAIIDEFVKEFTKAYKPYLVKSSRPHRPNVNMDQIVDAILQSNLLSEIQSSQGLMDFIKYLNINVFPCLDAKNVKKCIEKVKDIPGSNILYLSCDKDFTFPTYFEEYKKRPQYTFRPACYSPPKSDFDESPTPVIKKRKTLPKSIRTQLWDKYFQQTVGNCPLCTADMNVNSFQSSHIVSAANGGTDAITNLFPICVGCNLSMGSENMTSFVKRYYQKEMVRDLNSDKILIK